jgi:hypothetical protein
MKKINFTIVLTAFCLVLNLTMQSQDTINPSKVKVDFSGYLETYYGYDFNQPNSETNQNFLFNHNHHNEFNVNIGLIRSSISYENYYAKIALQAGKYVQDNYANEDLKLLNEAYIGAYLDKAQKMSVEAGIFASHIGFETATSHSNLNLTRSLLAENSPYFLSGVKFNYKPNEKWTFTGLLNNGWQRINKPNRKALPAFGSQIVYKPSVKSTLNWSTFIGDEPIGDNLRTRYFNNFYWDYQWNKKWRTIAGFDIGYQKKMEDKGYSNWMSPVLIAQYTINPKWQTSFRTEYYQDVDNVIIASNNGRFKTFGNSINLDFLPNSKVKVRTEARWLHADEPAFMRNEDLVSDNFFVTISLSFEW